MEKIYMDHGSSMPVDKRVAEFAEHYLTNGFGNPSSRHSQGVMARRGIENAREHVARLINAENPECIIFTGGATESNNLAIRGTALRNLSIGKKVAASAIEHMSVLNPMKDLTKNGFQLNLVPVDSYGVIDLKKLEDTLSKDTIITSVMHANNEIGTIEPIDKVSKIVHDRGVYLHVDATASAGRIPIDVQKDGIDLLTLSSTDIYGPLGAGALYVKPGVKIQTVMPGGGQERGLRSGTENLFAIAGMGEAARIAKDEMEKESARLKEIRNSLVKEILKIEESYLTGHPTDRLPHHASFRFTRIEGESILLYMDMYNIQIATGSACTSKTLQASHVLLAIGLKHEEAHGSMVLTLGHSNNTEQVEKVAVAAGLTVKKLRDLSPL